MDQRNPYGGRPGVPNGMPPQYMNEMMFDPLSMPMNNGMNGGMYNAAAAAAAAAAAQVPHQHQHQHPHQHPHQQHMNAHRGMTPNMYNPNMMENDPHFVDALMTALDPGALDPMGAAAYDQASLMRSHQHQQQQQQQHHHHQQQQQQQQQQHHAMGMAGHSPPQQPMQPMTSGAMNANAQRMPMRAMPNQGGMGNSMQMPPTTQMLAPPNGLPMNPMHQSMSRMPQSQPMPAQSTTSALSGPPVAHRMSPNPNALVPKSSTASNASSTASTSVESSRGGGSGGGGGALATTSSSGAMMSGSDDDLGGGDEDVNKKKERRRQQVRYASRRRRKKQKDEESFLRDRIDELKEQIRIIGGDLSEQCTQMAGMSEQALTEAYEKQMQTVQNLRRDNNKLKEQLLQHENFARMIQYGLNALPSDCRDVDRKKIAGVPTWFSDQMSPLKGPTLVVDLNVCHDAVRVAYNELKSFGPSVNSKTNVCFAMGWRTELWATGTCLSFKATRTISDRNIREVTESSWEIITSPDKCKRIYPDVKQFRVLQKVNDDIVVVHRIASVASDLKDREFISVAFRFADGNNYFVGLKTIPVQTECSENCIRGEECQGWMFSGDQEEATNWKANFLGYYDVKGEKDDKVLNQLANEAMFGMLRWESEAMHPLSV